MDLYSGLYDMKNLYMAWNKVRSNHAAPGVDHITVEEFETNKKQYLKQISIELKEERYNTKPAKMVTIQKGGKERDITILCIKDKVVQQVIVQVLNSIYEPVLSPHAYAYRQGKSALIALEYITEYVANKKEYGVIKTDISHFFDSIDRNIIMEKLREKIDDKKFLALIQICLKMRYIDENGELKERSAGIYQGSLLAPVLSNIYMMEFDMITSDRSLAYVRYSDDMICIYSNMSSCNIVYDSIKQQLAELNLEIKDSKTSIGTVGDGFDFLGYHISDTGKMIPIKAKVQLTERLEDVWLDSEYNFSQKLAKGKEIIGGWEQYYRGDRELSSIYEFVVAIAQCPVDVAIENSNKLVKQRFSFDNIHKDITEFMVKIWLKIKLPGIALREYEQYYQVIDVDSDKIQNISEVYLNELLDYYHQAIINNDQQILTEIMQIYSDIKCFNKARKIAEYEKTAKIEQNITIKNSQSHLSDDYYNSEKDEDTTVESLFSHNEMYSDKVPGLNEDELKKYIDLFVGREDVYARASVNYNGKLVYDTVNEPLLDEVIMQHINGKIVAASYVQRNNNTVKFIVFDVDLSKKTLLQIGTKKDIYHQYMNKALIVVKNIRKVLSHFGLECMIEFSGFRGYHVWIFVEEWISTRYANLLQDAVIKNLTVAQDGINIECFPNRTRTKGDRLGQALKLPWAKHYKSNQYSLFVNDDGSIIENQKEVLDNAVLYTVAKIKRVIASNTGEQLSVKSDTEEVDINEFKDYPEIIQLVLIKCGLARHIYNKAKTTGYLTHMERLTILYIFGHLGEDGKKFVHTVMGFTLNYQYSVTQRYIKKLPDKPISCGKLREQYKQLTAQVGCNCRFIKTKECYPSPVLHALKNAKDIPKDMTLPTSKPNNKNIDTAICKQVNIHKQASEIATKLVELRRQERGVQKAIDKQQEVLNELMDTAAVDCLEIDIGLLVRRKTEKGYEYSIEL